MPGELLRGPLSPFSPCQNNLKKGVQTVLQAARSGKIHALELAEDFLEFGCSLRVVVHGVGRADHAVEVDRQPKIPVRRTRLHELWVGMWVGNFRIATKRASSLLLKDSGSVGSATCRSPQTLFRGTLAPGIQRSEFTAPGEVMAGRSVVYP